MSAAQRSGPVDVPNARKRRSLLAATKARPVWVTSTPPSDGTPIVRGSIVRNPMGPVSRLVPNGRDQRILRAVRRSEEHTSELQSLMRISYAVFCLKKKINKQYYIYLTDLFKEYTINTMYIKLL